MKYKRLLSLCLFFSVFLLTAVFFASSHAGEKSTKNEDKKKKTQEIAGLVMEVADNRTYIMINDKKIQTHPKFIASSGLKMGDRVRIIARETEKGLQIVFIQLNYKKVPDEVVDSAEQAY